MEKLEDLNFETLMEKLTQQVALLEKGDMGLEESMSAYEKGIALVRNAEKKLKSMERRMEEILADGEIKELNLMGSQN